MLPHTIESGKTHSETTLIPVPLWNTHHPWPTQGGLRHLIFHKDKNGFAAVIRKIGRRVLIDEAAFFEWAKAHGGTHHA